MSQRGGPVPGRRRSRRVPNRAAPLPDPDGNRQQRRAWDRQNGRSAPQTPNPPRETQDGQTAAHGPAGGHDDAHEGHCPACDDGVGPCYCPDADRPPPDLAALLLRPNATERTETP